MEAVPIGWFYAGCNGVVAVLGWDGLAESDGDEQAGGGAFGVDGGIDGAGWYPVFAVGGDVLRWSV